MEVFSTEMLPGFLTNLSRRRSDEFTGLASNYLSAGSYPKRAGEKLNPQIGAWPYRRLSDRTEKVSPGGASFVNAENDAKWRPILLVLRIADQKSSFEARVGFLPSA